MSNDPAATAGQDYTKRLSTLSGASWKTRLNVQAPYRWNLRRLSLGRVLDLGCGIGRNLSHLEGNGVGVDHNPTSVQLAREAGLSAFTPEEFLASSFASPAAFDSLLMAHVLEHMPAQEAQELLESYLTYVRPGGRVVLITPQEKGYTTDATHVRFVDAERSAQHLREAGVDLERDYSFPFLRPAGRIFPYNEFVVVGRLAPTP